MRVTFDRGTLVLANVHDRRQVEGLPGARWDPRAEVWRVPAWRYADLRDALLRQGGGALAPDLVRSWESPSGCAACVPPVELRPYQAAAVDAWELAGRRGVIVLPTGSGKTHVGLAAAARASSTLCLVPTRVLLGQWHAAFRAAGFGEVGRLGDGERVLDRITVSTFESAWRSAPEIGDRFELLLVDEVHHLGNGIRDEILEMSLARARLGLTATPVEGAARERLCELVGPPVYELAIGDLRGGYLADFDVVTMMLDLTPDERESYERALGRFREWRAAHLASGASLAWDELVRLAARSDDGRRAIRSWFEAKQLVAFPVAKRRVLGALLTRHDDARKLVFTTDNDTAYAIAREHLVMCITCEIRRSERDEALGRFRRGELRTLVSARVLNEGIDVPDADVAIVVGGAGGPREHVQRVGRVLRPQAGKRALVYELVMRRTFETRRAQQRRRALDGR